MSEFGRYGYEQQEPRRPKKMSGLLVGLVAAGCLGLSLGVPLAEATASRVSSSVGNAGNSNSSGFGYSNGSGYSNGAGSSNDGSSNNSYGSSAGSSSQTTSVTAQQSRGVVLIDTTLQNGTGAGTGMVLTSSGEVLTNYHVVEGSTQVKVTVADTGKTYTASVLGHDASKDVAVLKLQGASGLATVTLASTPVSTGDQVTAVGNANGQESLTAVSGQVTNPTAQVTAADEVNPNQSETLTDVFETNAAVVAGDSGGPMYNSAGQVVGMSTAGSQSSGGGRQFQNTDAQGGTALSDSYAVTIGEAEAVVHQVETGTSAGTTQVGANAYLGVMIDTSQGTVAVAGVQSGTPAAGAGLQAGDTITSIGSTSVGSNADLTAVLQTLRPGSKVKVGWTDSSGAEHTATVTLASSPVN